MRKAVVSPAAASARPISSASSGVQRSSASRTSTQDVVTREIAVFRAAPIVVNFGLITLAPAARARSAVSSDESFSTTITSLAHSTLATHASMFADSSCAAITAVTSGEPRLGGLTPLPTAPRARVVGRPVESLDHCCLRKFSRHSGAPRLAHGFARLVAEQQPRHSRRGGRGVIRWIKRAGDAVGDVALRDTALASDGGDAERHQIQDSIRPGIRIGDDPAQMRVLHQADDIVALAEEADKVQNAKRGCLHPQVLVVRALPDDYEPKIRMPRRQHRNRANRGCRAAAGSRIVDADYVLVRRLLVRGGLPFGPSRLLSVSRIAGDIDADFRNRNIDGILGNARGTAIRFAREQICCTRHSRRPATRSSQLESLPRRRPPDHRSVSTQPAGGGGDQMLAIGADEDRIRVPAPKNPSQTTRGGEDPAVGTERNDLERLRNWSMTRLAGIATRRAREMHVAVRRHEQRDFGSALGNAAACSREQTGGP